MLDDNTGAATHRVAYLAMPVVPWTRMHSASQAVMSAAVAARTSRAGTADLYALLSVRP